MQILIKEPKNVENYFPFSETHCVWEIRSGILRLFEKICKLFPDENISFSARDSQKKVFLKRENIENYEINYDLPILEIFMSFVFDLSAKNQMMLAIENNPNFNINFAFEKETLAAYKSKINDAKTLNVELKNIKLINYLWEVLDFQAEQIEADAKLLNSETLAGKCDSKTTNLSNFNVNLQNIFIGNGVKIAKSAVLDATNGCIIIDDNAEIMHNSVIFGPCYIGKNTIIKVAAIIYENCSFGENCKIGGELENTIFHNYSNKQHSGFLGHSYIGEWVNFGANTNNSDLKNNYSEITMHLPHKKVKTGKKFLGCICGDHTKTAINSAISTGSILGTSVMLSLAGFSPKLLNSFSWITSVGVKIYDFEKCISTMKIVKQRRNKELLFEEIEMLKKYF